MSYLEFPKIQQLHVLDTADKLELGGYQPDKNGELRHVALDIFHRGTVSPTTEVQMGIHLNTDFSVAFALSDSFFLNTVNSNISGSPTGDWRAVVRFDFNRPNINKNQLYIFSLQTTGYTRTADTVYLAVVRDEPDPIYTLGGATYGAEFPASKSVFAFVEPS